MKKHIRLSPMTAERQRARLRVWYIAAFVCSLSFVAALVLAAYRVAEFLSDTAPV